MSILSGFNQAEVAAGELLPVTRKYLAHLLLAFCVGILPVLGTVAASSAHALTMPTDCTDCESPGAPLGDTCAHDECPSMSAACGSQSGAGFPGAGFTLRTDSQAQENPAGRASPRYRPDIDDSLYRPPIG
jgi:hypothetical protein